MGLTHFSALERAPAADHSPTGGPVRSGFLAGVNRHDYLLSAGILAIKVSHFGHKTERLPG